MTELLSSTGVRGASLQGRLHTTSQSDSVDTGANSMVKKTEFLYGIANERVLGHSHKGMVNSLPWRRVRQNGNTTSL